MWVDVASGTRFRLMFLGEILSWECMFVALNIHAWSLLLMYISLCNFAEQRCSCYREPTDNATCNLDSDFLPVDLYQHLWHPVLLDSHSRYVSLCHKLVAALNPFCSRCVVGEPKLCTCYGTVVVTAFALDPTREAVHDPSSSVHKAVNWAHLPIATGILIVSLSGNFSSWTWTMCIYRTSCDNSWICVSTKIFLCTFTSPTTLSLQCISPQP